MNIEEVEGIGPTYAATLRSVDVRTTEALLERGATAAGREALAEATGVSPRLVLEWVNHVDLMRIDGVGSEYSDLLEAAGVDSPAELAQRNPANLAQTFQELDAARPNWIRNIPSQATVEKWIAEARTLPKIVTHGGGGSGDERPEPAMEASSAATEAGMASEDVAATGSEEVAAMAPEAATAAPEPEPRMAAPASFASADPAARRSEPADQGLWARIKRLFGA